MTSGDMRTQLIGALRLLEQLQDQVSRHQALNGPIAVVGMGCRLPGGVRGPDDYWRLLCDGVDAVGDFPSARADITRWYDPDPEAPGKTYVRSGAFLDDVGRFDAAVFGISPREATGMDPQQRMVMEVAWEALEHAGYAPDSLAGSATGVYLGVSTTDYVRMRQQEGAMADIDAYQLMGEPSFTAGRLSFALGLSGPSQVVDTACSSSLVAVHDACRALRSGECDTALAGGVNAMLSPYSFVLLSKFRALSSDGRCKTFDASADGYGRGEGAGVVVLKRLADARRDGDTVMAVIRGSAAQHDGRSSGLTVPNPASQQAVIRAALTMAGLEPDDIDYVEAHGTGTALGDPIELRALDAALGGSRGPQAPMMVGSVKTNIGHLEAAAGIAGLMKLVLSIQRRSVPPHLHFHEPNPNVDWTRLRIEVADELRPWPSRGRVRAGGVSSFGASGTNAHVIVAEAPAEPAVDAAAELPEPPPRATDVLTLSARSRSALRLLAASYRDHLRRTWDVPFGDVCGTSRLGRARMTYGLVVEGSTAGSVADAIDSHLAGRRTDSVTPVELAPHRQRRVAWLFTGQGAQYPRMGRELRAEPVYRQALDQVAALMDPFLDRPLLELLDDDGTHGSPLDQTGYTQPCLFATEYALAQLLLSWGPQPAAVMGHSVGEITAACVAGVLSLEDAVRLVTARAELMQSLPSGGVMATLVCDEERARQVIAGHEATVAVAAVNGAADTVIAGAEDAVEEITQTLLADGVKSRRLRVSHAFHSLLMEPILPGLRAVTDELTHHEPRIRLLSNVSGQDWADQQSKPEYWVQHAAAPVRFADGIRTLYDSGITTYLEVGPAPVLLGLAARNIDDPSCLWIPSLRRGRDDVAQLVSTAGALHLRGLNVNWSAFDGGRRLRRVPLPTYPWEGESSWFRVAAPGETGPSDSHEPTLADAGHRMPGPVPTYRMTGEPDLAACVTWSLAAAADAWGGVWSSVESAEVFPRTSTSGQEQTTCYLTLEPIGADRVRFSCRCRTRGEEVMEAPWHICAQGTLRRRATPPDRSQNGESEREVVHGAAPVDVIRRALDSPASRGGQPTRLAGLVWHPERDITWLEPGAGTGSVVFLERSGRVAGGIAEISGGAPVAEPSADWHDPDDVLFDVQWHSVALPAPETAESAGTWLLVADRGAVAVGLGDELRRRGVPYVVLDATRPIDIAVAEELDRVPDIERIVMLAGVDAPDIDDAGPADLLSFRDRAELSVVHVVQALHRRSDNRRIKVYLVTRGAVPAEPHQRVHATAAAPLWGLGRVVALEHPELWGGAVDLDPDGPQTLDASTAELLMDALVAGGPEDQLSIRGDRMLAARLVRRSVEPDWLRVRPGIRADSTYLITGGLGGIGTTVANWLATNGAGALVLAGRTPPPDAQRWDDPTLDAAERMRIAAVRQLTERGVRVETVALDVADADAVARLVERLADGPLPLRGVVHAAGVSGPQLLREADAETYARVWRPKVLGAAALHRATVDRQLDFFLCFSSIAAVWGSQFLASYASANAFLDGLAQHRKSRGLAAVSVNWGQWDLESNLFGADVRDFLSATGLRPLPAGQCLRLLGPLLAGDDAQRIVCAADWSRYKSVLESRAVRPMLALVDGSARPTTTATSGDTPLLDRVRRAAADHRQEVVAEYLRDELAQIMRVGRDELRSPFHLLDMGIDSLMVMELITRIRQDSGLDFTSREFFATDASLWDEFILRALVDHYDLEAVVTATG